MRLPLPRLPLPGTRGLAGLLPAVGLCMALLPCPLRAQPAPPAIDPPRLSLKVVFLAGPQPGAAELPVGALPPLLARVGQPLRLTVHSGDVLALYFEASAPGLVRLTSIDAQRSQVLDTYVVQPGAGARLPRAGQGGIEVDEQVGQETLRIEYEPCLPEALAGQPGVLPFRGRLPRCQALLAGARPAARPPGAVLPMKVMPGAPEAGASALLGAGTDYRPGQTLVHELAIQHDRRP